MRTGVADRLHRLSGHSATRFLAVSTAGYAFDLALLFSLRALTPLPTAALVSIAFWVTYAVVFALNRTFAFRATDGSVRGQLARYLPQVLADFALTLGGVELFSRALGASLLAARMLAAATNATFNYLAYRWWTFREAGAPPG